MQPAQAEGGGSSSSSVRKWGPIAAIVAVVALVAGLLIVTSGGDDDDDASDTTDVTLPAENSTPEGTEPDGTEPAGGGEVTFPLSFSQAEEQGIEVAWGDNCDPDTGRLMVRDFFAPECYAPFEGDNGGETAQGVTADSIKVVYYLGPDD